MTEAAGPWTATRLFDAYFRPLYPPDLRDDGALTVTRATDANPAHNPRLLGDLEEAAELFARLAPSALGAADVTLDFTDASVRRLGAAVDRRARDALMAAGSPGDPRTALVNVVVHGAMYLGECIVRRHGGVWGVRRPLWESVVHLRSRAGEGALTPFHWWLKAFADHEIDKGGLASRYRQHVERATIDPASIPSLVTQHLDRKLPTLGIVRYEMLHKYLRAHVPELRDLGRDFPSGEELHEIGFLGLQFELLGGGRMLLMHGRGKRGLHLFWFDHQGFSHAAFFPASASFPHAIEVDHDKLVVRFRNEGVDQVHEMLWWG